ncbi:hypothetical protein HO173_003741 [Letharia columbiana]|uniref:Transcription factor 25 n=1 Tax=Letharia columbiana TaxID=112416 RepID=A0A8H6L715_9LECA|nr:uncharacterized protein HO173_003741 [Letharia columbiana]KAF6238107.1 hypothetical protein HO173_003741 [Letharia columbiana]
MSSRAVRKLQREQEQQIQRNTLKEDHAPDDESEEEAPAGKILNAFDMLNQDEDGDEMNDSDVVDPNDREDAEVSTKNPQVESSEKPKTKSKSKKKKNKKKSKVPEQADPPAKTALAGAKEPQLDEIDIALKSLSTTSKDGAEVPLASKIDEANVQLYRLLAVESKHLNALNEMKRLFGNVVLENEDEAGAAAGPPRRRGRVQNLDLGGALAGRHSPASRGQGLAGLALRRNPFILGKEEWPKATSGGLGMELVEKLEDGTVEFRFVHNTIYQDVQRQFQTCVESMDPQRMIALLQYNPYHISTLLQVSEIAKQQGDHSVSGDLLERALFSFGRSVHSSFTAALGEGKARLDFRRPENREFWLSAWRYVNNLGQRGTWRTAYEWAKLVLSLDPEGDPYRICLFLDQLALRGGQSEHLLQLSRSPFYADDLWRSRPNIDISSALAEFKLKQVQKCRSSLKTCVEDYPWVFPRLFKELSIDHIPKSVWGKTPSTDRENFECELYVHNAKDLWNTPEATSFLVEVVESAEVAPTREKARRETIPLSHGPITLDEARHVLLSGVPALINLIPRGYTNMPTSSSDPLPPPNNVPSYDPAPPTHLQGAANQSPFEAAGGFDTPPEEGTPNRQSLEDNQRGLGEAPELQGLQGFFRRFIPWIPSGRMPEQTDTDTDADAINARAAELGIPEGLIAERGRRVPETLQGRDAPDAAPAPGLENTNNTVGPTVESEPESEQSIDSGDDAMITSDTAPNRGPQSEEPYDDDRNQRWLAGQGMLRLRDFCAQHGTDETAWEGNIDSGIVGEYAQRVMQLRQQRTRTFIMEYPLTQGTSREVKALVEREIQRGGRLES